MVFSTKSFCFHEKNVMSLNSSVKLDISQHNLFVKISIIFLPASSFERLRSLIYVPVPLSSAFFESSQRCSYIQKSLSVNASDSSRWMMQQSGYFLYNEGNALNWRKSKSTYSDATKNAQQLPHSEVAALLGFTDCYCSHECDAWVSVFNRLRSNLTLRFKWGVKSTQKQCYKIIFSDC